MFIGLICIIVFPKIRVFCLPLNIVGSVKFALKLEGLPCRDTWGVTLSYIERKKTTIFLVPDKYNFPYLFP